MLTKPRCLLAVMFAFALIGASCSNSGDDTAEEPAPTVGGDADGTDDDARAEPDGSEDSDEASNENESNENDGDPDAEGEPAGDPPVDEFVALEGVPGVTDEQIAVAVIGTKSNNPLGTCILDCYVTGIQALFDMVNAEGGVHGRQLVIDEVLDDELVLNQAKSLEVVADDDALAAFVATLVATGYGDLHEAGVPTFNWGLHPANQTGLETNYGYPAPTCPNCTNRFIPLLAELAGATRVATLGYGISENSKVCAGTYAASIGLYADDVGAEVVYTNDELEFGLPNGVGPQVTEMIDAGVDFIASCLDLNAMKTIALELERQGVRDQITMHHPNSYDSGFVADAGDLFDGDFVVIQFAPFESNVGTVAEFQERVAATGGPSAETSMIGWVNASLFVEGLRATGPEFSRGALVETINSEFTAFSAGGLINPVDWTRQHVSPTPEDRLSTGPVLDCVAVLRMQDGAFDLVAEPDAPFLCWDNVNQDWAEPQAMSFE